MVWVFIEGGMRTVVMQVGLPSVCLSVPAVQEQKVCTASVDRQTHHNSSADGGRTIATHRTGKCVVQFVCQRKQNARCIQRGCHDNSAGVQLTFSSKHELTITVIMCYSMELTASHQHFKGHL